MQLTSHSIPPSNIAEISSNKLLIQSAEDGLDLLGNMYYQGFDAIVLQKENITPDFFDLKNGLAGEILQKFSTYRMRLAIVGDFSSFTSTSLNNFIYESNKGRDILFVSSTQKALELLASK